MGSRFLILSQYYPPEIGAPQVRLPALARELVRLGHTVEVVTALPNHPTGRVFEPYRGRFYAYEEIDGIPVHRLWLYAATGAGLKRMASYASFCLTSLVGLLKARRPDYVFVESPPLFLSVPGLLAARFWGAKAIFNVADLWPDSVRALGLLSEGFTLRTAEALEAWTYRQYDYVTAVTDGIRDDLITRHHVPAEKVLFLPNGVDTALFRSDRPEAADVAAQYGFAGKKVFLYAGTVGYAQGLDTVLSAAALLSGRDDVLFLIVGDGPEKPALAARAAREGLTSVRFLDPVPLHTVASLFAASYAGLVVLRDVPLFEGARPSKLLPTMASGLPVVYSGAGEGARLVTEGGVGRAAPPEDPQALARIVAELLDDPDAARGLGAQGRAFVEQRFSWKTLVRDWMAPFHANGRAAR